MKVHLRKRKMRLKKVSSKCRYSLCLDIYYRKGKCKLEFLGIYLEPNDENIRNEKLKLADKIKAGVNPGRLHQKMTGYRKKNKLEIGTVTI